MVTGIQTEAAPKKGIKEFTKATNPKRIGTGTPATTKPIPAMTPWAKAVRNIARTTAVTVTEKVWTTLSRCFFSRGNNSVARRASRAPSRKKKKSATQTKATSRKKPAMFWKASENFSRTKWEKFSNAV